MNEHNNIYKPLITLACSTQTQNNKTSINTRSSETKFHPFISPSPVPHPSTHKIHPIYMKYFVCSSSIETNKTQRTAHNNYIIKSRLFGTKKQSETQK